MKGFCSAGIETELEQDLTGSASNWAGKQGGAAELLPCPLRSGSIGALAPGAID